ncbi:unnamed protein product [Cladocopium goreaui]|uniref:Peptidyl-tRNA hydrolase (PTH) n=1 Tax=Cladocopium goreaui TaxID=2562237 RepID=A0A9P1GR41_9DINO|nr:unnamed protein product [Cladocopium goreaui]|mmetsp:Transcript_19577/g.43238  ORF Transcript_19577/g.43238 Transcript_19577/m.43238 type:complete len:231 (-) Transcript_19577:180-872(-)
MSEPPSKKQRTGIEDASKTPEGSRVLAVLGLGNPGGSYKRERHSLGARVAAALVQEHKACSSPERKENENKDLGGAVWLRGEKFQAQVLVLEPQRPINDNGPQLHSALSALNILDSPFLAIVDDCWLPLGSIRFREKGSSGGHKGLEGIEAAFDCKQNYHRLRLGIGGKNLKEFVTGTFTEEEETLIEPVLTAAVSAVEAWLKLGPEASQKIMSIVNAPTFTKDPSALKR